MIAYYIFVFQKLSKMINAGEISTLLAKIVPGLDEMLQQLANSVKSATGNQETTQPAGNQATTEPATSNQATTEATSNPATTEVGGWQPSHHGGTGREIFSEYC